MLIFIIICIVLFIFKVLWGFFALAMAAIAELDSVAENMTLENRAIFKRIGAGAYRSIVFNGAMAAAGILVLIL